MKGVGISRKKTDETFTFAKVPFIYDSDDYHYIPGLWRQHDQGFLTPVFFAKEVLIKYDVDPAYRVNFASRTYGTIEGSAFSISFGINRFGHVIMWLGDIAKLPDQEQYYLRSANVPSDHSLGSEFYDGQIECVFTEKTPEDQLLAQCSHFDACFKRFGQKIAHLDAEVLDLALRLRRPVVDTAAERTRVGDVLNKIYLESLDSKALGKILVTQGADPAGLGSLKRLQKLLEGVAPTADIASTMSPLYTLYDLRVAYSHLGSAAGQQEKLETVYDRLKIPARFGPLRCLRRVHASPQGRPRLPCSGG